MAEVEVKEQAAKPAERTGFRSDVKPIWCPGCGDHAVLNSLVKALEAMELKTHNVALISGIGCSSRIPGYLRCYGFNSIHGRALPIATGVKLARPRLTVIAAGGDGDGFAIGGNHVMHAARRNVDITYIMMDNGIYGLTKGQVSPTTPLGYKTKTTAYGAYENPMNPLAVMLAYGTAFVAQGFAADMKMLQSLIIDAVKYPGFSYVNVISPCVTYRGGSAIYKELQPLLSKIPEDHDVSDWVAAHHLAVDQSKIHVGVLYKERRETFLEAQAGVKHRAPHAEAASLASILNAYT